MKRQPSIITVGLTPAWDMTCRGENLDWGRHKNIDEQTITPAGKALNVSKALAWMGQKNTAAGLWGGNDYQQMQTAVRSLWPLIKVKMTAVTGNTRQNVTIVDTAKKKDMHLRRIQDDPVTDAMNPVNMPVVQPGRGISVASLSCLNQGFVWDRILSIHHSYNTYELLNENEYKKIRIIGNSLRFPGSTLSKGCIPDGRFLHFAGPGACGRHARTGCYTYSKADLFSR